MGGGSLSLLRFFLPSLQWNKIALNQKWKRRRQKEKKSNTPTSNKNIYIRVKIHSFGMFRPLFAQLKLAVHLPPISPLPSFFFFFIHVTQARIRKSSTLRFCLQHSKWHLVILRPKGFKSPQSIMNECNIYSWFCHKKVLAFPMNFHKFVKKYFCHEHKKEGYIATMKIELTLIKKCVYMR